MRVEVAYATPQQQRIVELDVVAGCTARQAALQSALDQHFESLSLADNPLGIFGKRASDDQVLQEGDRVELYRPLLIDPKEARRLRAEKKP
ncbi:MAG: RnfH family protein [Granulosicoccaceae bacterium]